MQQQKERDNSQSQLPPRTPTPLKGMGRPLWGEEAAEAMGNRLSFRYLGPASCFGLAFLGRKAGAPCTPLPCNLGKRLLPGALP